ncbi:MAG TPA: pitrilysin family protein [Phycisphaerae bacterium]|nr:pitrilysin family protein [Phycisphaerae bacterium]
MKQTGEFFEHRLDNGLRVVIERMPHIHSAAAGFLVQTGARDEIPALAGVSHFVEHMCFKGTPRRTWREITVDFDNMGSTYNAYTSKERTVYFGWVRVDDLERQIELLADMMGSMMPPEEFEMEKKVILEEIAMSADQIDHCVYDLLHEDVYAGHPLAWPVLGTTESITALTRDQLHGYFEDRYHPANMVLIIAGNVDPAQAIGYADKICGRWVGRSPRPARVAPPRLRPMTTARRNERFGQQAIALSFDAPSAVHPDREAADVFASILGGHNSRFYWNIIQAGVAPQVSAGRLDYCDAAMMVVFGFCEPPRTEEVLDAMRREIDKITKEGVTPDEVQRVKNRSRTGLTTEAEAPYYRLMQLVNDIDDFGRPRDVGERLAAVEAVTPESIAKYLRDWPMTGKGCLTSLGPRDWPGESGSPS